MSTLRTKSQSIKTLEKVDEEAEKTQRTFLDNMDAIAYGVQARLEEKSGSSRRVTEATVEIARELGIPEGEIKRWAASRLARLIRDTERLREIKSRLERLQGSFGEQTDIKRDSRRAIRSRAA